MWTDEGVESLVALSPALGGLPCRARYHLNSYLPRFPAPALALNAVMAQAEPRGSAERTLPLCTTAAMYALVTVFIHLASPSNIRVRFACAPSSLFQRASCTSRPLSNREDSTSPYDIPTY